MEGVPLNYQVYLYFRYDVLNYQVYLYFRYDVLNYQVFPNGTYNYVTVGTWDNGTLHISSPVQFNTGLGGELVESVCAKPCKTGHYKVSSLLC